MNALIRWTVLAGGLAVSAVSWAGEVENRLRATLLERLPGARIESISKLPKLDLYEVVMAGLRIVYVDPNGDFALFGNLVDLKSRTNLTERRQQELSVVDFARLPLDKAIVKVKGNGSRRLAIFTDPDCPFCQRLEAELAKVTDVTVYIFLLPIPQLHPDAARKARAVWCAHNPVKAWDELMLERKEPPVAADGCTDPIAAIAKLADQLNITGTPGLVFGSGRLVPGAINAQQIEQYLQAPGKS
jgi:thiol:disulfide interchange protein DsbC